MWATNGYTALEIESEEYKELKVLLQELLDKDTPTTPNYEGDGYSDGKIVFDTWICPCCGEYYEIEEEYDYCPKCGQCIDWEMWKGKNDEE